MRFIINIFFLLLLLFFNEGVNVVNVCISLELKGHLHHCSLSAVFAAAEMNTRHNLIQRQQWHIKVKAMPLCVFEYKTELAQ